MTRRIFTTTPTGVIAPGKRADVRLLNANPLQDITQSLASAGVHLSSGRGTGLFAS